MIMATIAKMYCSQVVVSGGSAYVPICTAHKIMDQWPPSEEQLGTSGMYGHDVGDCHECQDLMEAHPDLFFDGPVRGGSYGEMTVNDEGHTMGMVPKVRAVVIPGRSGEQVTLTAVKSGAIDDPNNAWALATPDGSVELHIDNPLAWGKFEPGREYYVEIREVVPQRGRRGESGGS